MTVERAELMARAERCLRRGELAEALGLYRALVERFPEDQALARKLSELQASVDPRELMSAKLPSAERDAAPTLTAEQEGERLFGLGDYAGAAAAYRRALRERPDSELLKERLFELYRLARQIAPTPDLPPTSESQGREPLLRQLLERIAARKRAALP
jgi:tetratricopeptide (TPR) repeat protein